MREWWSNKMEEEKMNSEEAAGEGEKNEREENTGNRRNREEVKEVN